MTLISNDLDKEAIDQLVGSFFALFTNKNTLPNLQLIYQYCIDTAVIAKNTAGNTEIYDLATFIAPRSVLLTGGRLIDFEEQELTATTVIQAHIAQRLSVYQKQGVLDGTSFVSKGTKMFQFLKIEGTWKISAVIWVDATS